MCFRTRWGLGQSHGHLFLSGRDRDRDRDNEREKERPLTVNGRAGRRKEEGREEREVDLLQERPACRASFLRERESVVSVKSLRRRDERVEDEVMR